jgi:hypothetical protein
MIVPADIDWVCDVPGIGEVVSAVWDDEPRATDLAGSVMRCDKSRMIVMGVAKTTCAERPNVEYVAIHGGSK